MSYTITTTPTLTPGEPKTTPILNFLSTFYQTSDTESQHEKYVSSFTHDATLIMGSRKAVGTDEIRTLRHAIWTHVASRRHFPEKVFFGADDEVMLYGTVKYVLKADAEGKEVEVPWAGRVVFDLGSGSGAGEDVKMKFYQVYLRSGSYALRCLCPLRSPWSSF